MPSCTISAARACRRSARPSKRIGVRRGSAAGRRSILRNVDLPAPFAPMIATVSPSLDARGRCRTAPGSRRRRPSSPCVSSSAIAGVTPRCPYRSRAPRREAITARGSPSAILRPKLSTTSRSTTASSACTTCSIQTIVMPRGVDVADRRDQVVRIRSRSGRRRSRRAAAAAARVASARASSSRLRSSSVSEPAERLAAASRPVRSRIVGAARRPPRASRCRGREWRRRAGSRTP